MTNLEKYEEAFMTMLNVSKDVLEGLKYGDISDWDSVGHMSLITALEESFEIMLETDDIIEMLKIESDESKSKDPTAYRESMSSGYTKTLIEN